MSQARELAPHRILVNTIVPGFIDVRLHPGERGAPSGIAAAAVYLAPTMPGT